MILSPREAPERLIAWVALPEDFEGPASIAIGFSDGSERVLSESFAVVDPLVEAAFTPIDKNGDPVPAPVPITDELISRLSVLSFNCPNPSVPSLALVDTTSVAPPPSFCKGWPKEYKSEQAIRYYFRDPYTGQPVGQNCPVRLKLLAMDQSGFHCHSDPDRPVGEYGPKVGNTGEDGLQFRVEHEWPRCATLLEVMCWSTQEGCPFYNDSTYVHFYFSIVGSVDLGPGLEELLPGTGYTLKEPTAAHPDAYWGLAEMNTTLQAVAAAYADSVPGSTLGFNDMSLPWGGTFDINEDWNPPHCGHQVGNEMDFRSTRLTDLQQGIAWYFFRRRDFERYKESDHWHVKYYGPGTYLGPGSTLHRGSGRSSRGVAIANDARVLFADSLYTWSAATNVIPEVNGQATWHPETNSWTYTYTVKNDISSPNVIRTFGLAPVLEPQSIVAPTHWYQGYGFQERSDAVVWMVVDQGPPPVGWDSVSAYPGPFDIQPGDSVSSFSIVSPYGPGWITYFVEGYYDITLPDEPSPPSLFNNSITGTVVGPAGAIGGVDEVPLPSAIAELRPPVPSPARATVSITFYLPEPSHVVLAVYDVAGRRVRVLVDGDRPSGVHSSSWNGYDENGRRVSAGVYFYQLRVGGKPAGTGKVVVVP